jgi:glycosyltransferase involved in cell wall biosynthesis
MGLDDDEIVFAIIGSITRRKGHDRVLAIVDKVFEVLPGAKLLVVGETNLSEEDTQFFNSLPNRMHPKVQFTGYRGDIENVMHSIDILLVPSRHEGQGQVVTQAMACRKPVVGAIVGGIAEAVIDGKTGLLVSGDEQDDWLNAMIRLGRDVILRKQMGNAGRERVEQLYEWEHEIGRLFDVIDSCG